jgi:hypothetical protein
VTGPAPAAIARSLLAFQEAFGQQPGFPQPLTDRAMDSIAMEAFEDELQYWDIDGLKAIDVEGNFPLEVGVGVATWTLSDRPELFATDSPGGMRVTSYPMQLYIHPSDTYAGNLKADLEGIQDVLVRELVELSCAKMFLTGHRDPAGRAAPRQLKHLGKREVSSDHLSKALEATMAHPVFAGFRLSAMGFGQRIEATDSAYYEKLRAALVNSVASHHSYVDIAVELGTDTSNSPCVVLPTDRWTDIARYADYDKYPAFPGVSPGAGSVTFKKVTPTALGLMPSRLYAGMGTEIQKVKVYSVWAHHLANCNEVAHVPLLVARKNGDTLVGRSWFHHQLPGITSLYRQVLTPIAASGIRVEFRVTLAYMQEHWGDMRTLLLEWLQSTLATIKVGVLRRQAVVHQLWLFIRDAYMAGLFDQSSGVQERAPNWKADQYHRLLSSFGFSCKYWSRGACAHGPYHWGPLAGHVPAQAAGPVQHGAPKSLEQVDTLNPKMDVWRADLPATDLNELELAIYTWLVQRGPPAGRSVDFPWYVFYQNVPDANGVVWGNSLAQPRSKGYASRQVLARCIAIWAGPDWINRRLSTNKPNKNKNCNSTVYTKRINK